MTDSTLLKIALSKAMAICSKREYCIDDLRNKLKSWKVEDTEAEKILQTLQTENFINESRYAEAFVKDRFKYNKWGKIKISAHLRAKNISSDKIKLALESIDNETYKNIVKEILNSHRKSIKAKNQYDLKGKLFRFGLSKGYESELLYDILSDLG
jgi:regulatory protein